MARKPSPKQLAAQKRFAAAAKKGTGAIGRNTQRVAARAKKSKGK
jgi:hypothetical protein